MATSDEFPRLRIVKCEVEASPEFSAEREITPLFNREVPNTWAVLFWDLCDRDAVVEFLPAGFARGVEGDVEHVIRRLNDLCDTANDAFITYLRRKSTQEASDIVELEQREAQETDADGLWRLPPRATPYTY